MWNHRSTVGNAHEYSKKTPVGRLSGILTCSFCSISGLVFFYSFSILWIKSRPNTSARGIYHVYHVRVHIPTYKKSYKTQYVTRSLPGIGP